MRESIRLFRIFIWKNWRQIRYSWVSLFSIFVGCSGIFIVYLISTNTLLTTPQTTYYRRDSYDLKSDFPTNEVDRIFYAPSTSQTDLLMEAVRQELQYPVDGIKVFNDSAGMVQEMERSCKGNCYAVHFLHYPLNVGYEKLQYSIRSTIIRISPKKRYVNDEEVAGIKDDDDYIRSGFMTLQHVIDKMFITIHNPSNTINFDFEIASMPTIAQKTIESQRIIWVGSLYSIIFNVLLLSTFLVPLVEEKQNGIKEFLAIATPMNFLNGVSFFVIRLLMYGVFTAVVLIAGGLYQAFSPIVPIVYIIILFTLYILSAMSYTYLISVFFHSVFHAKVGGLFLLVMPYILYFSKGGFSTLANIFSTKTFMEGIKNFQIFTNKYREVGPSVLNINITESSFTVMAVYSILIGQCLIYALLYNYLSYIFPGPGSLKRSYLFPIMSLWKRNKPSTEYTTSKIGTDAIIIQNLKKVFKKPRRVISDDLNMVIKNKQITVLLGHNGVGKTTTLNMIMGSEQQDSGKITVCGEGEVGSYRHLIGYCPQHSVFMPYMTCAEHLNFFAQVRGMSEQEACKITDELLIRLNLQDKENEFGNCLSGGMKRRLSLGIAIAGNTKVVILDEPSSGLDIESRRELWDILLKLRKIKAVLITTHHMEEAEVLGDTIAILANGRVHCSGSPLELKRKIGRGYVLKLCISNHQNEQAILQIIQHDIPTAKILTIVPPAMHISLPYENKSEYSQVLHQLETRQEELGIDSISLSDASLEDVFLNCLYEIDVVDGMGMEEETPLYIPFETREPSVNWKEQFRAIFYKKFIFIKNQWAYTLLMVLLPMLSLVIALALMHSMSLVTNEDKLTLNLTHIQRGIILIDGSNAEIVDMLKTEIKKYDGIQVEHLADKRGDNVTDLLINLQTENLAYFLENYIGVIDLDSEDNGNLKFNIYFSGNIYHSSVILMNLVDDTIARWKMGQNAGIETTYAPIRRYITDVSPTRLEYFAVIIPIGLFFSIFFYVALPFHEHASGFKQLQAIPRSVFWLSTFAFDATLHFFVCLFLCLLQALLMPNELYSLSEQLIIIASIFFYGCSYLPILYSLANAFRSISTISTYMLFMLIVSAIVPLITSGNVRAMEYHEGKIFILMLLPDFNFNHQMRILNERFLLTRRNELTATSGLPTVLNVETFFFEAIVVSIIVMTLFVGVLEDKYKCEQIKGLFKCYQCRQITVNNSENLDVDEELATNEKIMVAEILSEKTEYRYPLLVNNLYKFYERKVAVCGINFVVKKQECFGLLGVNGAGKTSTFQMIAANRTITGGTIKINGIDIIESESKYRYCFGYCPQTDCLNEFMTAYQTLFYMAKLRGISDSSKANDEVLYWLQQLDLRKYKNVEVRQYSGGTKRKLNAALAMIGSPSLVLLDEPTTGVDPESRRFLWKCIKDYQHRGKTVVLTSHSMDECEQLCNRLAIMTGGKFKCSGFVPDLKKRFGSGFTIKIKLKSEEEHVVNDVTEELSKIFTDCQLRENHAGIVTYFIKNINDLKWSDIFINTEAFSSEWAHFVEDYSVNETTLEDIFLKFEKNKGRTSEHQLSHSNEIEP
ncbi:ATP-binding cassette sub-family A member 2 [Anastrepha obliqua]|uniref:ATP-binding cassette sub-family A member 2 n=1 Tax=Anastrepha obliqua TaxID=95512 RepID=UPI00240A7252|nr:ATP-binding cassette sub-family A member 2 [Anastrepha obliqua]XP_054742276.1 ATP-binding cassette sub-family A member 2 [Anastrepha obliqua]XP_054742277.1 ATP-binding cassette sub-family A member 2 [Anastrepha obliqua]